MSDFIEATLNYAAELNINLEDYKDMAKDGKNK